MIIFRQVHKLDVPIRLQCFQVKQDISTKEGEQIAGERIVRELDSSKMDLIYLVSTRTSRLTTGRHLLVSWNKFQRTPSARFMYSVHGHCGNTRFSIYRQVILSRHCVRTLRDTRPDLDRCTSQIFFVISIFPLPLEPVGKIPCCSHWNSKIHGRFENPVIFESSQGNLVSNRLLVPVQSSSVSNYYFRIISEFLTFSTAKF